MSDERRSRIMSYAAAGALAATLLALAPLAICSPLWVDATHYDVCAQEVLRGRVLYRDVTDTNFPGVVWIHCLVRGMAGWRSEVLQIFDLVLVGLTAWLLPRLSRQASQASMASALFCATAMLLYYFACPSICHCQRDVWMLALAALALTLRQSQFVEAQRRWQIVWRSALEGCLWGAAVWIKPYVIIPALACWAASQFSSKRFHRTVAAIAIDNIALVAGGLVIGALGGWWLWQHGSWQPFTETTLGWSQEYRAHGTSFAQRGVRWLIWNFYYFPWSLLHYVAVPVAVAQLARAWRGPSDRATATAALLAAFYLAWLAQAALWQHPHDYVLASAVLVALPLLASWPKIAQPSLAMRCVIAVFFALALVAHPLLKPAKLALWPRTRREGASPAMKDQLATPRLAYGEAHWQDLARVAGYLRSRGARDREVLAWDDTSHPLFVDLGISPSSRFIHAAVWLRFFAGREDELRSEFEQAGPRFVVTDLALAGFAADAARDDPQRDVAALPAAVPEELRQEFPWRYPVVFRAGRYLVHEAPGSSSE